MNKEKKYELTNDLEYDKVKDEYCPQCYFNDDVQIKRKDCKHKK